jgi:SAM-dependent methyltransferase
MLKNLLFIHLQGVWCVEMALKYPTAHVVGWALDLPTVSVPESLKNLSFAKVDLFQPDAGIHLLESDTVDFMYIRDLACVMATNERWLSAIKEAYRVLRPGGWIEIIEPGKKNPLSLSLPSAVPLIEVIYYHPHDLLQIIEQ